MSEVRIDKYLWAIRQFKTRSQATDACKRGKIFINNTAVKASHNIHEGEKITLHINNIAKTIQVIMPLHQRLSATEAAPYFTDLTPQEEYDKQKLMRQNNVEWRPRGLGRPTKKERRSIDRLKGFPE